jgi:hypothetical protein
MRALTVVLALVALPLVASLAQQPQTPPQTHHPCESDVNVKCNDDVPPPPPPPPTCGPTVSGPTATVSGSASNALGGLSGVCIQVLSNGALVAGDTTSGATATIGSYSIGLAPPSTGATYLVCAVAPTGLIQTFPDVASGFPVCPSGFAGYSFALTPGGGALLVNFTF